MLHTRLTIIAFLAATWCWTSEGKLYYDVACPGVNMELRCPEGQEIEGLSMQHGVMSAADCAARDKPATVSDKPCLDARMLGWVKQVCDKLQRCRLPKPNEQMFVCGNSMDNFIQITYKCHVKQADVAVVCEEKTGTIKCDHGVLNIVKASFGRLDENTCTKLPSDMTFCTSRTAGETVTKMCNNKKSCTIAATVDNLGKPDYCDSSRKYLTVDYVCQ